MISHSVTRIVRRLVFRGLAVVAVIGAFAGCGDTLTKLLRVPAPGLVIADSLTGPRNALLLVQSAVTDFECGFSAYVIAGGLFGDELADATVNAPNWPTDRRDPTLQESTISTNTCDRGSNPRFAIYTAMQTARFEGDDIARQLKGWTDAQVANRQSLLATAYAYAGYAVLLLGESYCTMAIDLGPELTRAQTFAEAETRFTNAIAPAQAAGTKDILNMALLGRARARLDMAIVAGAVVDANKLSAAAADAALVPQGFVKNAAFSTSVPRRYNQVFNANNFLRAYTIEVPFRNLLHQGVPDPRVPVTNTNLKGSDGLTPAWAQGKYTSLGSSIPIARWAEAQLIIAEADANTGDLPGAVAIINSLHSLAGIPQYPGGTASEVLQHLVQERRNELFLEGQHIGDMFRLNQPFFNPPGTPYPSKAGGVYGPTGCLPLPTVETANNPNIKRLDPVTRS
jgi:hypothetical protein